MPKFRSLCEHHTIGLTNDQPCDTTKSRMHSHQPIMPGPFSGGADVCLWDCRCCSRVCVVVGCACRICDDLAKVECGAPVAILNRHVSLAQCLQPNYIKRIGNYVLGHICHVVRPCRSVRAVSIDNALPCCPCYVDIGRIGWVGRVQSSHDRNGRKTLRRVCRSQGRKDVKLRSLLICRETLRLRVTGSSAVRSYPSVWCRRLRPCQNHICVDHLCLFDVFLDGFVQKADY